MRNIRHVNLTDIWSWYRVELRVGDHLGRSEELVSRCVECDLAEPESLASLGGSAPGVVDGILLVLPDCQLCFCVELFVESLQGNVPKTTGEGGVMTMGVYKSANYSSPMLPISLISPKFNDLLELAHITTMELLRRQSRPSCPLQEL